MGAEECERVGARGGDGLKPVNSYNTLSVCLSLCLSVSLGVCSHAHTWGAIQLGSGTGPMGGWGLTNGVYCVYLIIITVLAVTSRSSPAKGEGIYSQYCTNGTYSTLLYSIAPYCTAIKCVLPDYFWLYGV